MGCNCNSKVFIFIGPPGAGKGSLSKLCSQRRGWKQLSTGNLCRKHIAEETAIGKEIDLIIKSGKLIGDDLITQMVAQWLEESMDVTSGIILDGYPRTLAQARLFGDMIKNKFPHIKPEVVGLSIPDEKVIKRLSARFVCQNAHCQAVYSAIPGSSQEPRRKSVCDDCSSPLIKRDDDSDGTVYKRIMIYRKHENELLNYYRSTGQKLIELDADRPLDDLYDDFIQVVIDNGLVYL